MVEAAWWRCEENRSQLHDNATIDGTARGMDGWMDGWVGGSSAEANQNAAADEGSE